jgi:hypothetical protein
MVEVRTSEVDTIPVPVSLDQQWVKFHNHCWAKKEFIVVKQWVPLLETAEQQWDWRVLKGMSEDTCATMVLDHIRARLAEDTLTILDKMGVIIMQDVMTTLAKLCKLNEVKVG